MGLMEKLKCKVNAYLERLAQQNQKTFGEGKLECCQLKNQQTKK